MSSFKKGKTPSNRLANVSRTISDVVAHQPMIVMLFVAIAVVDFAALTALFLSHSGPFNDLFGPVIRRLWGDRFLHYPDNFLLLPKLFGYAHVLIISTFGLLVTAVVIRLTQGHVDGDREVTAISAVGLAFRKYFQLLIVWIPLYFLMRFAVTLIFSFFGEHKALQIAFIFFTFLIVQILSAFLYPAIVASPRGFFGSLGEGLALAVRHVGGLCVLLFFPVLIGVAVSFAKSFAPFWVRLWPESILVVLAVSIILTTMVDLFVTTATAVYYVKTRGESK